MNERKSKEELSSSGVYVCKANRWSKRKFLLVASTVPGYRSGSLNALPSWSSGPRPSWHRSRIGPRKFLCSHSADLDQFAEWAMDLQYCSMLDLADWCLAPQSARRPRYPWSPIGVFRSTCPSWRFRLPTHWRRLSSRFSLRDSRVWKLEFLCKKLSLRLN